MSQNRSLRIDITRDRHHKPLAIVKNLPGLDAEMYSDNLRKLAAELTQAADDMDALNSEQAQAKPTKAIFKHRFDIEKAHDKREVVNAVNLRTVRANSILYLLSGQFDGEECRLSDRVMSEAIHAAIDEINDIDDIVNAYFLATRNDQPRMGLSGGAE
jgi:hypothetical protein